MEILKKRKKSGLILSALILIGFVLTATGCPIMSMNPSAQETGGAISKAVYSSGSDPLSTSVIEKLEYPFGIKSAATGTDAEINAFLETEYEAWKTLYLTSDGAGPGGVTTSGYLRIQRDDKSNLDTVSEGQAYGLLFAVYFDDEDTFEGLLRYTLLHCDPVDLSDRAKRNDKYPGLMHWIIDENGNETTEFGILRESWPANQVAYMKVHKEAGTDALYVNDPSKPEFELGGKKSPPADGTDAIGDYTWAQAAKNDRSKRSSATDADVDIAAALIMASKMWPKSWVNGYQYQRHAASYLTSLLAFDIEYVDSEYWLRAGNLWGGKNGWNPCYYTPAWFRMFKEFIIDNSHYFQNQIDLNLVNNDWDDTSDDVSKDAIEICDGVIDQMYEEMLKIDAINSPAGLYPDWVNTVDDPNTTAVEPPRKTEDCSDRRYYFNNIPSGTAYLDTSLDTGNGYKPSHAFYVPGPDGIFQIIEGIDAQSFNYYYDAVRVPWRIAMDYSYYGDPDAKAIVEKMAGFFKTKRESTSFPNSGIVDGYKINGASWDVNDKDGFNIGLGGTGESVTFTAMNATAAMVLNDLSNAQAFYDLVVAQEETVVAGEHHYYGNSVRLLSLLYMSGRMLNLGDIAQGSIPPETTAEITTGPLTIDTAYTDYAAYGSHSILLNDRSAYFNADKTEYANVGAGLKDLTYDSNNQNLIMNIGYGTWINGAVCGLPYLIGRDPKVNDWVLATGTVYKSFFNKETHPWSTYNRYVDHYQGDPGLMDFSIDMADFTPDLSEPITVGNGGDATLNPADYGAVKVMNNNAKLRLSGGIYHMESLTTEPDAEIYFDTTSKPVIIFVKGQLTIKPRTKFLQSANKAADPSRILIVTGYNGAVTIGPQTNWRGTLIAPNAAYLDVNLHNPFSKNLSNTADPDLYEQIFDKGAGFGAIWGKRVEIHQDSGIFFTKLDWDAVENIGPNPEIPDPPQGDVIDLTSASSGYTANISQSTTYKIKLGGGGTFQISQAWGDNVKISIDGEPVQNKPEEWGGAYTELGENAEVLVTLVTTSSISVSLSWW